VFSATILPVSYKVVPSTSSGTIAYKNGATFTFNAADTYRLFIKDATVEDDKKDEVIFEEDEDEVNIDSI
jgi:hypothetical protein